MKVNRCNDIGAYLDSQPRPRYSYWLILELIPLSLRYIVFYRKQPDICELS
jgi:hypothetical protein